MKGLDRPFRQSADVVEAELAGMIDDLRNVFNLKVFDDKPKALAGKW